MALHELPIIEPIFVPERRTIHKNRAKRDFSFPVLIPVFYVGARVGKVKS